MPALRITPQKITFNARSLSARGLGLLIEHLPCCLLTVAASMVGIPFLSHNPLLEFGFAIGGALIGEYIGHNYILRKMCADTSHTHGHTARRYAIALAIGLATWGAHQMLLHDNHDADIRASLATPASTQAH